MPRSDSLKELGCDTLMVNSCEFCTSPMQLRRSIPIAEVRYLGDRLSDGIGRDGLGAQVTASLCQKASFNGILGVGTPAGESTLWYASLSRTAAATFTLTTTRLVPW